MMVKRGEAGTTLGGNEHLGTCTGRLIDDKIGIANPMSVFREGPTTSSIRTSKYGPSCRSGGSVVSSRRASLRVTRAGKRGSLDMLSNLVTKRNLPSGQVLVDPLAEQLEKANRDQYRRRRSSLLWGGPDDEGL